MTNFMYVNPAVKFGDKDIRSEEIAKLNDLKAQGYKIVGLEMTVPALADYCDKNIDPQHTDGKSTQSCVKEVVEKSAELLDEFKGEKVMFTTNRVDLDSVASYVVADKFLKGEETKMNVTIMEINAHDAFQGSKWTGPKPIEEVFDPNNKTKALAASIKPFMLTPKNLEDVATYVETGKVDEKTLESYRSSQQSVIDKVNSGEIKVEVSGGVAFVNTSNPCALAVGYSKAPVVIAENPKMPTRSGDTYRKLTICQHELGYIDLDAVKDTLNEKEPGWGGSKTILGSRQNEPSELPIHLIKKVVQENLSPEYKEQVNGNAVAMAMKAKGRE